MDIVQQLRSIGCNSTQGCATDGKPNNICRCIIQNDAADEIERLREALSYCACVCEKPCGKHLKQNGQEIPVQCTGWIARSALQQKDSE